MIPLPANSRERLRLSSSPSLRPPADVVLGNMLKITENVAIVLPPFIKAEEFEGLPEHEREKLYLGENHELYCLYFGGLKRVVGESEFHIEM